MDNRIIRKKYYKITFDLASPLALGSGENDKTDKDLVKDSNGNPFIPATSVAGVVRERLMRKKEDQERAKKYLGDVIINRGDSISKHEKSMILFYDAVITGGNKYISVRDSVALDEFKTAKKSAKFDMEVLEPGVTFTTYIEQDFIKGYEEDYGREIAAEFLSCPSFGGKSTRGYGLISNPTVKEIAFEMEKPEEVKDWLDFDLFDDAVKWRESDIKPADSSRQIILHLKQRGGISIRKYTTKVSSGSTSEPDMEQLTLKNESPVIPGTSWAGAISHRMEEFEINVKKGGVFGFVNGDGDDAKSRSEICFGETILNNGKFKVLSRNAIDRFTGGTVDGALFTEKTYYGGEGDLVIRWKPVKSDSNGELMPDKERKALAAALADLHYGLLAVGGETSIGRGLFRIENINKKDIPGDDVLDSQRVYEIILKEIEEAFGNDNK